MFDLIVDSTTIFRALLIGSFLWALPRITRRGLLFGSYVGEDASSGVAARNLVRSWSRAVGLVVVTGLAVGLAFRLAGWPLLGNRVSLLVLLASAAALYVRFHYAARRLGSHLASRPAATAAASLIPDEPRGLALPIATIIVCLIVGGGAFGFAASSYPELPQSMPSHTGPSGEPDAWQSKSFASVMTAPLWAVLFGPYVGLMGLMAARAKRSVRLGGGDSVLAQTRFRSAFVRLVCGLALLSTALFAWISVQSVRIWLGQASSWGPGFWWLSGLTLLFVLGSLLRLVVHHGQGGALVEDQEGSLTNGLADDSRWVLGIFYADRDDPSIMVEERFGVGYTVNLGNPTAVAISVGFVALITGLMFLSYAAAG